jgi:hypothetical protein
MKHKVDLCYTFLRFSLYKSLAELRSRGGGEDGGEPRLQGRLPQGGGHPAQALPTETQGRHTLNTIYNAAFVKYKDYPFKFFSNF